MNKLILFSSGLDSTFLVYKALKEGHSVYVVYTDILNNVDKSKIEKQNIQKLVELFREEFGNDKLININECGYKNDEVLYENTYQSIRSHTRYYEGKRYNSSSVDLKQSLYHLMVISTNLFVDNNYNFFDEIEIGYIMNDGALSYLKEIKNAYKSLCKLTFVNGKEKYPKLKFPLIKTQKKIILDILPEKYVKFVWTCEIPILNNDNIEMCGCCEPCKKLISCEIFNRFTKSFKLDVVS